MRSNLISKLLVTFAIIFAFSSMSFACEFYLEEVPKTEATFSPELLWGLFIILFHIAIGIVHTFWREKKTKKE